MRYSLASLGLLAIATAVAASETSHGISFDRDIRPILSENCFACHGPDHNTRKGKLRLDTKDGTFRKTGEEATIVAGKSKDSELYKRIISTDADEHMPPAETGKKLSKQQIDLLARWIDAGAPWAEHWSFVSVKRPEAPRIANKKWSRNPIDSFILSRLERENLKPNDEASKETLIRRATLDLTGLPPTPAEIDAFLKDKSKDAYEKVVDRLLTSPHYGERMAVEWLDAARFADTHGYHIDSGRDMTRWREWVIDAYNQNKPFDQFTVEQLAGDLLPNATIEQKIASGFNRNNMINFEGGAIAEEYLAQYVIDRVNTTGTVFLGLSVGCAQCHDHKYDPISQKEFYQLYAFFHNVPENGLDGTKGNAVPVLRTPSHEQETQIKGSKDRIAELETKLKSRETEVKPEFAAWDTKMTANANTEAAAPPGAVAHFPLDEKQIGNVSDTTHKIAAATIHGKPVFADGKSAGAMKLDGACYIEAGTSVAFERTDKFSCGGWINQSVKHHGAVVARMDDAAKYRGWDLYAGDGKIYVHMISEWEQNGIRVNTKKTFEPGKWHHVFATYDGSSKASGIKIYVDGKAQDLDVSHDKLSGSIKTDKPLRLGSRNPGAGFKGLIDDIRIYDRELSAAEVAQLAGSDGTREIFATPADKRKPEQQNKLLKHYLETVDQPYQTMNKELAETKTRLADLEKKVPTTMVMQEMPKPRDTFMLMRGQYDKKGEKVTAGVPASLPPLPAGAPPNRLGLAKWLVDPAHPLMSRVIVNRFWQMYFGTGLVKTAEDFGTQGERPVNPELLDWLSAEFINSGWDVKALQRLIVTSAAYRQSASVKPALLARDPENRLLAHGPRVRLTVEFIRDQALAVSGLLNNQIGGASVSPYQPKGIWEDLAYREDNANFSAQVYKQSHGSDLYRRTMYTFWKRTAPPPTLVTFDAPDRETCCVRRAITNTPLQALVLMNDPTYIEAARKLAERMMTEGGSSAKDRISFALRLATARNASSDQIKILKNIFDKQLAAYRAAPDKAEKLLAVGESARNEKLDAVELAAWTIVASTILNLDEAVTKG